MRYAGTRAPITAALLTAAVVAVSGCGLPSTEACPGDSCTTELRALGKQLEGLDKVVVVRLVSRSKHLEDGEYGNIDVTAAVADESGAQQLADELARLYVESDVPVVRRVTVDVEPSPARTSPQVQESTMVNSVDAQGIECAEASCAAELGQYQRILERDFGSEVLTVDEISWHSGERPESVVRATYLPKGIDRQNALDIQARVLRLGKDAGVEKLGNIHLYLQFQETVTYTFRYDGSGKPE